jgi:mRNA-degrading endonuclease YafQ of YafQ-DinJ toxin-antitoxin module
MYTLQPSKYAFKKIFKLHKQNKQLTPKIKKIFILLSENPFDPKLKSHKVSTPKFGEAFSTSITGDLRIIWNFINEEVSIIDILDIGGHSGSKGVY